MRAPSECWTAYSGGLRPGCGGASRWATLAAQPTLDGACYLAAAELAGAQEWDFWTADRALPSSLGAHRPDWVHHLSRVGDPLIAAMPTTR